MKFSLQFVKSAVPQFERLAEQPVLDARGQIVGWHSTALGRDATVLAGGTHSNHETSRRIALAEMLERAAFQLIHERKDERFRVADFPSSSGFAAGFEGVSTRFRSIAEAIERWVWSQWIDMGLKVDGCDILADQLSPLASHLLTANFSQFLAFRRVFEVDSFFGKPRKLQFCAILGLTEHGTFPGSRVTGLDDDAWTHAAIEAWRHYLIGSQQARSQPKGIITDRILYFAQRREEALAQVRTAAQSGWPAPRMLMLEDFTEWQAQGVWVSRAICDDYLSWDKGPVTRFVY